jgi:hypothetical protein
VVDAAKRKALTLDGLCFDKEADFVRDPARLKAACTTRRAGKTVADAAALLISAIDNPDTMSVFSTLTREMARDLVWSRLMRIREEYSLGGDTNDTLLRWELPNKSIVKCFGAKDRRDIDKMRGLSRVKLAVVDEAQSIGRHLEYMIDEVIEPFMVDVSGCIALTGTPGPIPQGYFYDLCTVPGRASVHRWTLHDNKFLGEDPNVFLARLRARRGITEMDAGYRREYCGEWVVDMNALVFPWSQRNHYTEADLPTRGKWTYVMGVDVGVEDADAIAIEGWTDGDPHLWHVAEFVQNHQSHAEMMGRVKALCEKYRPIKIVCDPAGGGKRLIEDLRREHRLPIEAAEKTKKIDAIMVVADWLRTGAWRIKDDSALQADMLRIEWDPDARGVKVGKSFHSDIADASLYAAREARHYRARPLIAIATEEDRMITRLMNERTSDPLTDD